MPMDLQSLNHAIWVAGIGVQLVLAAALLFKRLWRRYPAFCGYTFFNLFQAALTYPLRELPVAYFYVFWACEAIGIVLGLAVVREIFTAVFSPHPALRKLATVIFRIAIIFLVGLACVVIYVQSMDARDIPTAVLLAAEAARLIELGLIMFLFLSASAFGLHWRQHVFGIALGLGMFAAVQLTSVTLLGHVNSAMIEAFSLARSISFAVSLLIWLGYLVVPEKIASNTEIPKRAQLEQWNQAVMELISQ
jgi:hypothetical protein